MRLASSFAATAAFVLVCVAGSAQASTLDPPLLDVVSADRSSITLNVEAGPSGTPGGFVLEWMSLADYQAYGGWPADPVNPDAPDANLLGIPTLNTTPGVTSFRLEPGQSVRVVAGEFFDETGLLASDRDELQEGTDFVFRVRANASQGYLASDYSPALVAATEPRGAMDCTATLGFWKNHPEAWSRVDSIMLGDVSYTNAQLMTILNTPAKGNGLISLAHQLISAKLNELLGALPTPEVATAITQADALIGSLVVPPVGGGALSPGLTNWLTSTLGDFNNGTTGPGHCPDSSTVVPAKQPTWGELKVRYR